MGSLRARVFRTLALALIGALGGYAYARARLPPTSLEGSSLPGMYGVAGAATLVLSARIASIIRLVLGEFRRPPSSSPGAEDDESSPR